MCLVFSRSFCISRCERIFSDNFSSTIFPGPSVTAPPSKLMTLEPRLAPPAASRRLIAMFNAVPEQRSGRHYYLIGQGSV